MNTLSQRALLSVATPSESPARKMRLLDRFSISQILREEYVYEVHGPFIAEDPPPPRPRLAAWIIAKLAK